MVVSPSSGGADAGRQRPKSVLAKTYYSSEVEAWCNEYPFSLSQSSILPCVHTLSMSLLVNIPINYPYIPFWTHPWNISLQVLFPFLLLLPKALLFRIKRLATQPSRTSEFHTDYNSSLWNSSKRVPKPLLCHPKQVTKSHFVTHGDWELQFETPLSASQHQLHIRQTSQGSVGNSAEVCHTFITHGVINTVFQTVFKTQHTIIMQYQYLVSVLDK